MRLAPLLVLLLACGEGDPPIGRVIDFTPPPEPTPESLGLPRNDDGTYTLIEQGGSSLRIDPTFRSPVSMPQQCAGWLTACHAPPERTMDDCFRSVPRCSSPRSWETRERCCPEACWSDYEKRRRAGEAELDAWLAVIQSDDCFPGLAEYLAGGRP
jgi:hypothetical protein